MTELQRDFIELVLANGLRHVGDEIHGDRPGEIADRIGLDRKTARRMCIEWLSEGWYVAADGYCLHGFVTPKGEKALRKLI